MRSAYESYMIGTPLIGNQNFLTLTTHVIMQAPNYTATAEEMGYAANVTPTGPECFQSAAYYMQCNDLLRLQEMPVDIVACAGLSPLNDGKSLFL